MPAAEGGLMISRRTAGLLSALTLAILLGMAPAPAQEGASSVAKTPPAPKTPAAPAAPKGLTEPEDVLSPPPSDQIGATGAPPPSKEIVPSTVDEGAGWEAAVEA